jgi:hypothetical protein
VVLPTARTPKETTVGVTSTAQPGSSGGLPYKATGYTAPPLSVTSSVPWCGPGSGGVYVTSTVRTSPGVSVKPAVLVAANTLLVRVMARLATAQVVSPALPMTAARARLWPGVTPRKYSVVGATNSAQGEAVRATTGKWATGRPSASEATRTHARAGP